ncbi:hypothetical protein EYW47_20425 [Paraburkholderia silviterrae]|uniref:Uncharacterized protein n=1 Tax=Paraburkholderia silviterrae TaxID=2528715 RepID=A0A4R5M6R2_9BURK|nr:hypothetical protein EYW47_20425 [Paraburkholderia silviterrae]
MNRKHRTDAQRKRLGLSAHEVGALMLLDHAPVESRMNLDFRALLDAGLAESVVRDSGISRFAITRNGKEVLLLLRSIVTERGMPGQHVSGYV